MDQLHPVRGRVSSRRLRGQHELLRTGFGRDTARGRGAGGGAVRVYRRRAEDRGPIPLSAAPTVMPGFTSRPCRWTVAVLLCAVGFEDSIAAEVRWPQFRGPGGSGVAEGGTFPTEFGPGTNLHWRIESPPGHSSPCIWDDHLFLTGWEEPNLVMLCLNTWTGERRWQRSVLVKTPEPIGGLGSPAAPTSCTDGTRVFSYFGAYGVICHDFDGTEIWRRPLEMPVTGYGVGSSPVLAGHRLILLRDADLNSHLLALDAGTGSILWRRERPEFGRGFSTPLVLGSGKDQIILAPGTLRMPASRSALRDQPLRQTQLRAETVARWPLRPVALGATSKWRFLPPCSSAAREDGSGI